MGFLTPDASPILTLPEITPGQSNLNAPPLVTITRPSQGRTILGDITIMVSASDPDPEGSIQRVEFYANATRIGEVTAAPYSMTWQPTPGLHVLTARAIDDRNGFTDSATVTVTSTTQVILGIEPVLTDGRITAVGLSFDAAANTSYSIETTGELFSPVWSSVLDLVAQPFSYTPTLGFPLTPGTRYFRLRVLP